jgi:serine/threonine protein kinase
MLKEIDLQYSSAQKQRAAECEIEYLKVIQGPTIIKFHQSYVENKKIQMLMEFADGGILSDQIIKNRISGNKFTDEQILMYTA